VPSSKPLEIHFPRGQFGLSVRRLYEHVELRQRNPFAALLGKVTTASDAGALVDVIEFDSLGYRRLALSMRDLADLRISEPLLGDAAFAARESAKRLEARLMRAHAFDLVLNLNRRRAARSVPEPFLPAPAAEDLLGVPGLHSRVRGYLAENERTRREARQWLATLRNLSVRGLRVDELQHCGLTTLLETCADERRVFTGRDLLQAIDF